MKKIETEILINASKNQVWKALMSHQSYEIWNPFIKSIKGSPIEGNQIEVTMEIEGRKPMAFKPEILINKIQSEFRWKGKMFVKGLFDGEHYFKLEESKNGTKLIHGEIFSGMLVGVVLKSIEENTLKGFQAMNEALKNLIENQKYEK